MTSLNTKPVGPKTHEGGPATHTPPYEQLRRAVLSCLLWEDQFYEDGVEIATRIQTLAAQVKPTQLSSLAIIAKEQYKLRHIPLMLAAVLCRTGSGAGRDPSLATQERSSPAMVSRTIDRVIKRADELAEFVAIYAKVNGVHTSQVKKKLSAQAKLGLATAFTKFDAYALAKYNRDTEVKLRDVLFLCHAKPKDEAQAELWKKLINDELPVPDTWEVALSGGADKKEVFERLLTEKKLGYMALIRNLRNMVSANVDSTLVRQAILDGNNADFPFRFYTAARHAPMYEAELDQAMCACIERMPKLSGTTVVLVDVSGSMNTQLSGKSEMSRMHVAASLGAIVQSDTLRVFSFSSKLVEVPARRGMAGVDAVIQSQTHSATNLRASMEHINKLVDYDRLIVITDEQSNDGVGTPKEGSKAYMLNVASYKNGVGYGKDWTHINGFSEHVLRYIYELETELGKK